MKITKVNNLQFDVGLTMNSLKCRWNGKIVNWLEYSCNLTHDRDSIRFRTHNYIKLTGCWSLDWKCR